MKFFVFALLAIAVVSGDLVQETKKICEPGTVTKVDCNNCMCSKDGLSRACTLMACPPLNLDITRVRRQTKEIICEAGKRYKKYCNTCGCNNDGTGEICTRMECPKNIFNEDGSLVNPEIVTNNPLLRQRRQIGDNKPCVPGTSFKRYCNSCHCGPDGISAACTMMYCPKDIYNEDGTLRNIEGVSGVPLPLARSKISS